MDEPPPASPLGDDHTGYPIIPVRSPGRRWARLLVIALVFVTPLAYIVCQQSPELPPRVVVALIPPTVTPTATATPVPLVSILRARPLRLPTLPSGSACPVTPARTVNSGIAEVAGDGPVYLVDPHETIFFPFAKTAHSPAWAANDGLMFLIRPGVEDDVLVRGHQVDGGDEVRFGKGDEPDSELIFKAPAQARLNNDDNWSVSFNTIRLLGAGCYAIQIDSETATSVIIFRAAPQQG